MNAPPCADEELIADEALKSFAITEAIYCAKTFKIIGVEEVFLKNGLGCWGDPVQCFCLTSMGGILYWPNSTHENWGIEELGLSYGRTILDQKPEVIVTSIKTLTQRFLD